MKKWVMVFLLLAACSIVQDPFDVTLEPSMVSIESGALSEEIRLTIERNDKDINPGNFQILLSSKNRSEAGFYDSTGKPMSSIDTQYFNQPGDRQTYTFHVSGEKLGSTSVSTYELAVRLYLNREPYGEVLPLTLEVD